MKEEPTHLDLQGLDVEQRDLLCRILREHGLHLRAQLRLCLLHEVTRHRLRSISRPHLLMCGRGSGCGRGREWGEVRACGGELSVDRRGRRV